MPYITQTFTRTVTDGNVTDNGYWVNSSQVGSKVVPYIPTVTKQFFNDLKSLLDQTGIPITYDEENCNFTVFGLTFGVYCYSGIRNATDDKYYVAKPIIIRYGEYSYAVSLKEYKQLTYGDSYCSPYVKYPEFGPSASLCNYSSYNDLYYRINIYYNTNFLYITYGPKQSILSEITLASIIKGKTLDNRDIVYTSGDCNFCNSTYTRGIPVYHSLVYPDNQYTDSAKTIPTYGNCIVIQSDNTSGNGLFTKVRTDKCYDKVKNDSSKLILLKPICCNGYITFDNLYTLPDTMPYGYYEINNDIYYSPQSYGYSFEDYNVYASDSIKFIFKL